MTDTLKTRNLIVTLPDVTGAEADEILTCIQDSLAPLVDDPRADHALGETQSPAVHVSPNREGVDLRLTSGWNIADVPNSGPGCFLTPYEARQLVGALLAIPGVADAEPPSPVAACDTPQYPAPGTLGHEVDPDLCGECDQPRSEHAS